MTGYRSTWNGWNDSGTSSSTTSATWGNWVTSDHYSTANLTSTTTWTTWTSTTGSSPTITQNTWYVWQDGIGNQYIGTQLQPKELTPEEVKRNEEERIHLAELAKEKEKKAKEIAEKAYKLLLENLTKNQKEVFETTGVIPIECRSGRKYHIRKGISGNVHELDEKGGTKSRLCFHPADCPEYDVMLAQKLMLEVCEEEARRIANFS